MMDSVAQTDAFFAGKGEQWTLFECLRERVFVRWPSAQLRVMKTCISFDDPKPFIYVSFPPKKSMHGLLVTISLREKMEHSRFFMVVPIAESRFTVHMHVEEEAQINEELLELIALSHR